MSLVVAIKTNEGIVMGCDSQVSYGNNKYSLSDDASCKIWNIINCPNGLMGSVGMLRDSQIISAHAVIDPTRIITDSIDFDYVVCDLYTTISNILESYHRISLEPTYDKDGNFVPPILNNEFIFAYNDKAYQISQEGCVRTIDDYLVIGSGADIATGVLDNNHDKPPEERIIEAITCCNKNTLYIDNNIILSYTYDKDCENTDCEECERKNYCRYYVNEVKENEDLENNNLLNKNISYDDIEKKSDIVNIIDSEKQNKELKKSKKIKEKENDENRAIFGRFHKYCGKHSKKVYCPNII